MNWKNGMKWNSISELIVGYVASAILFHFIPLVYLFYYWIIQTTLNSGMNECNSWMKKENLIDCLIDDYRMHSFLPLQIKFEMKAIHEAKWLLSEWIDSFQFNGSGL